MMFKSSHQRCSVRKGFLRKFAKFTEKHLCQSLFFNKVAGLTEHLRPSKHSPWWRRLTSSSSQDVFKTSWSRRTYSPYLYVFRRRLDQDQHIRLGHTFSRRLQYVLRKRIKDVFKTSLKHLQDVLLRRQDISKTSSRRLQDVLKMSSRHFQDVLSS